MSKKRVWELRDPGAKAEARKYAHPIPSRTYIRQYLEDQGVPVPFDDLVKAFGLDPPALAPRASGSSWPVLDLSRSQADR